MKRYLWLHGSLRIVLAGALLPGLCGCRVHKEGEGASKKVDVETPVGSFHVNTQVDPKDTGLAVYPGATRAEDEEREHAANLSMDNSLFGMKVVAIKFHSGDAPDKLLDFYRKQLKAYGDVTECHGNGVIKHGEVSCLHMGRAIRLIWRRGQKSASTQYRSNQTDAVPRSSWCTCRHAGKEARCNQRGNYRFSTISLDLGRGAAQFAPNH